MTQTKTTQDTKKEVLDILMDLNNPQNIIYKSAVHAMALASFVSIVYGKNNTFKFKLSPTGEKIVAHLQVCNDPDCTSCK